MQDFDEMDELSQEEFDKIDAIIFGLAEEAEKNDEQTSFLNIGAQKLMMASYNKLKDIVSGSNVQVRRVFHEPYNSMGYISIVGNDIVVKDSAIFAAVLKLASNIEIYPKTDGTVQINLTYHGLTMPIE